MGSDPKKEHTKKSKKEESGNLNGPATLSTVAEISVIEEPSLRETETQRRQTAEQRPANRRNQHILQQQAKAKADKPKVEKKTSQTKRELTGNQKNIIQNDTTKVRPNGPKRSSTVRVEDRMSEREDSEGKSPHQKRKAKEIERILMKRAEEERKSEERKKIQREIKEKEERERRLYRSRQSSPSESRRASASSDDTRKSPSRSPPNSQQRHGSSHRSPVASPQARSPSSPPVKRDSNQANEASPKKSRPRERARSPKAQNETNKKQVPAAEPVPKPPPEPAPRPKIQPVKLRSPIRTSVKSVETKISAPENKTETNFRQIQPEVRAHSRDSQLQENDTEAKKLSRTVRSSRARLEISPTLGSDNVEEERALPTLQQPKKRSRQVSYESDHETVPDTMSDPGLEQVAHQTTSKKIKSIRTQQRTEECQETSDAKDLSRNEQISRNEQTRDVDESRISRFQDQQVADKRAEEGREMRQSNLQLRDPNDRPQTVTQPTLRSDPPLQSTTSINQSRSAIISEETKATGTVKLVQTASVTPESVTAIRKSLETLESNGVVRADQAVAAQEQTISQAPPAPPLQQLEPVTRQLSEPISDSSVTMAQSVKQVPSPQPESQVPVTEAPSLPQLQPQQEAQLSPQPASQPTTQLTPQPIPPVASQPAPQPELQPNPLSMPQAQQLARTQSLPRADSRPQVDRVQRAQPAPILSATTSSSTTQLSESITARRPLEQVGSRQALEDTREERLLRRRIRDRRNLRARADSSSSSSPPSDDDDRSVRQSPVRARRRTRRATGRARSSSRARRTSRTRQSSRTRRATATRRASRTRGTTRRGRGRVAGRSPRAIGASPRGRMIAVFHEVQPESANSRRLTTQASPRRRIVSRGRRGRGRVPRTVRASSRARSTGTRSRSVSSSASIRARNSSSSSIVSRTGSRSSSASSNRRLRARGRASTTRGIRGRAGIRRARSRSGRQQVRRSVENRRQSVTRRSSSGQTRRVRGSVNRVQARSSGRSSRRSDGPFSYIGRLFED